MPIKQKGLKMLNKNAMKYRATKALVSNGVLVSEACRRTGLGCSQFYVYRKKDVEKVKAEVSMASPSTNQSTELPIEEQVVASDLSAKAKVKILATLLNA